MIKINKIHCGDCLELMKDIPDKSVDMILCDLPYGTTQNKWDLIIDLELLWEQYNRIIKDNGIIVLNSQGFFSAQLIFSNKKMFRYSLIWKKTTPSGHLNANRMPMRIHEDIIVFYKKIPTYNPQKTYGHIRKVSSLSHKRNTKKSSNYGKQKNTPYDSTERYPTSVLEFKSDKQKSALHPTQKPVALFEYLIKTYTNEGDLVLDNCVGSGTTAVACINTDRNFIAIEKEKEYVDIARKRVRDTKKNKQSL